MQNTRTPSSTGPVILPTWANWKRPVKENFEFKTDILTSENGTEQRRATRSAPRRALEFRSEYVGEDRKAMLERALLAAQGRPLRIADPTNFVTLTQPMGEGATGAFFDGEVPKWAEVGVVVILAGPYYQEAHELGSVQKGGFNFKSGTLEAFPAGTRIHFAPVGWIDGALKEGRYLNTYGSIPLRFRVLPGEDKRKLTAPSWRAFGEVVFPFKANWKKPPQLSQEWQSEMVGFSHGQVAHIATHDFMGRTMKADFLGLDREKSETLIDFFISMRGRQRSFRVPTYYPDMHPVALSPGRLQVDEAGLKSRYGGFNGYDLLMLRTHHNHQAICKITDWQDNPDAGTSFDLEGGLVPGADSAEHYKYASWLQLSRFASDRLDIEWMTDTVARTSMSYQTIRGRDQ